MKDVKLVIEGFIIGIGKIIPGVSGAMFAMMFGVYEKAIAIISDIKKLKGNVKFMLLLSISIFVAIVFGSSVIKNLLDKYYLYTMMLFIGMMMAGIKPLAKNIDRKTVKSKNVVIAMVVVALLVSMSVLDVKGLTESLDKGPVVLLIIFICGILDACGTVIPGVCGTALLMVIGYYEEVLNALSNLLTLNDMYNTLYILLPFALGLLTGVVLVSKLINYLFNNYRTTTYCSILSFAIASTIILLVKVFEFKYKLIEIVFSLVLCLIGYIIVHELERNWGTNNN